MNAVKMPDELPARQAANKTAVPSNKTVDMVESVFAEYSGFKKSEVLRRKIKRVVEGKDDNEILAWVNEMVSSRNDNELSALSEDLTNNETFFFRDFIQFECLQQHILPQLVRQKAKSQDKVIRIWSAACSTGEEAYSLAIIALEFMIQHKMAKIGDSGRVLFNDGWSLKVFGTDISRQVVKLAQNAIYSNAGLSSFRSFPKHYYPYFEQQQRSKDRLYNGEYDTFKVKEGIRSLLYFDRHNLNTGDLPLFLKNMDVIFCRNMMIYIDPPAQKTIQKKFAQALSPKGYLVMSVVDTMHEPKLFCDVRMGSNMIHQRR